MNDIKVFWRLMTATIIIGLVPSLFLGMNFFNLFFFGKLA